jgi:tetratricopeptide (TPR) repeat protein
MFASCEPNLRSRDTTMTKYLILTAICAVATVVDASASPHGDLHERIALATKKIAAHPDAAALYVERGELYRQHGDWAAAHADYDRAEALEAGLPAVRLCRAQAFFDAGRLEPALAAVDGFLARDGRHGLAHVLRARILGRLERFGESAAAWDQAIAVLPVAAPDHFLARADALVQSTPAQTARAIAGLEEALTKLGGAVAIELRLIDLLAAANRLDDALAHLDRVASRAQRQESWLAKRGDLLAAGGRTCAARSAYAQALAAVARLDPRIRALAATKTLERRVRGALDALSRNDPQ